MSNSSSQPPFRNDSPTFLKQKIIHYRSEVSKLQNMVDQHKKEMKRRNTEYELLRKELLEVQNKEPEIKEKERTEVLPYFNYSFILPTSLDEDGNCMIIGNLVIKNIGNTPLTTPIICIKIEPANSCSLSGKIRMIEGLDSESDDERLYEEAAIEEWVYVHQDWRKKVIESGEYWLRPSHATQVPPGEQISFSNFNLSVQQNSNNRSIVVTGFVYFEQLQKGIGVLNPIVIN